MVPLTERAQIRFSVRPAGTKRVDMMRLSRRLTAGHAPRMPRKEDCAYPCPISVIPPAVAGWAALILHPLERALVQSTVSLAYNLGATWRCTGLGKYASLQFHEGIQLANSNYDLSQTGRVGSSMLEKKRYPEIGDPPYGVPAILSLFFPGLGQLVKGHWPRTIAIWLLLTLVWSIYGLAITLLHEGTVASRFPPVRQELLGLFLVMPAIATLAISLWSVVDAYRSSED